MERTKIIVAPARAKRVILDKQRRLNPFSQIKIYSKEDLIAAFYGRYDDDALIHLIDTYHLDFEEAKKILVNLIPLLDETSDNPKISKLIEYRKDLVKRRYIIRDKCFEHEFENADIEVYYYPKCDKTLDNIIGKYNPKYLTKFPTEKCDLKVNHFEETEDEIFYVVNQIAGLIEQGVPPNKIFIYGVTNENRYILSRSLKNTGINVNGLELKPAHEVPFIREFLANFLSEDVDVLLERIYETYSEVYKMAMPDFFRALDDFVVPTYTLLKQYRFYETLFANNMIEKRRYMEAIEVVESPIIKDDEYLFIINFVSGTFPELVRDNDYLSDIEKASVNLETSREINYAKTLQFKAMLLQNPHIFISYSDHFYSQNYHPHYFLKLLIKDENIIENPECKVIYSFIEGLLKYGDLLDLKRKYLFHNETLDLYKNAYLLDEKYRSFLPVFNGLKSYVPSNKIILSYSALNKFNSCQFYFFLDYILRLTPDESNFNLNYGTYAHQIFENIGKDNFKNLAKNALSNWPNISAKDKMFLNRLNDELKKRYLIVKEFEKRIKNPTIFREEVITIPIEDFYISGKIDKLIVGGDKKQYLIIIDYKSGKETFNEKLFDIGQSMQLPTYALLASKSDKFSDKIIAGIYIRHLRPDRLFLTSDEDREHEERYIKLDGVSLNDTEILSNFDIGINEQNPKYIDIKFRVIKNELYISNCRDSDFFIDASEEAKDLFIKMKNAIISGDFKINPKKQGNIFNSCTYCPYRDVCYRKEKQYIDKSKKDIKDELDA